ncbi:MAG: hypothetical protein LBF33_02260 [Oscillospiraceae bacterium]|nr:hypothetical protein [Oscillospiraceae bacterium]
MKKILVFSVCLAVLCTATSIGTFLFASYKTNMMRNEEYSQPKNPNNSQNDECIEETPNEQEPPVQSITYLIKAYKGKIAVFEFGDTEPFKVMDCQISILPKTDQKALEIGVQVEGEAELTRLLQDYCS